MNRRRPSSSRWSRGCGSRFIDRIGTDTCASVAVPRPSRSSTATTFSISCWSSKKAFWRRRSMTSGGSSKNSPWWAPVKGRLPDPRLDHAVPVAISTDDINALGDAGHVGAGDEVARPASRTPLHALFLLLGFSGHPVGLMALPLSGTLACIPPHGSWLGWNTHCALSAVWLCREDRRVGSGSGG